MQLLIFRFSQPQLRRYKADFHQRQLRYNTIIKKDCQAFFSKFSNFFRLFLFFSFYSLFILLPKKSIFPRAKTPYNIYYVAREPKRAPFQPKNFYKFNLIFAFLEKNLPFFRTRDIIYPSYKRRITTSYPSHKRRMGVKMLENYMSASDAAFA